MFTCKQVSKSLAEEDYENLSPIKKCLLKLHVKLCIVCGKFNGQVMDSHDMCRSYKNNEHTLEPDRPKMDETEKSRLRELIAREDKTSSDCR